VIRRPRRYDVRVIGALVIFLAMTSGVATAGSLRDTLNQLVTFGGLPAPNSPALEGIATLERVAAASADRPPTATTPGFLYRFNPELGTPQRIDVALGPVFAEPAETVGARTIDASLTYLYSDFTNLGGESLADALGGLNFDPEADTLLRVDVKKFTLVSNTLLLSSTYGLTDRWDVNVLLPLIFTHMELKATSLLDVGLVGEFTEQVDTSQDKFGPGDVLVRTKYRLPDYASFKFASLLSVRLPTGNEDNFQGLGDVVVTPQLVVARNIGPHDVHLNCGVDVNATNLEASRVRYAAGAGLYLTSALSALVDVIGTSSLSTVSFTEQFGTQSVSGTVARTNIVDVYAGFKTVLPKNLLLNLGALVPVTNDGLRAAVVPVAGVQATF